MEAFLLIHAGMQQVLYEARSHVLACLMSVADPLQTGAAALLGSLATDDYFLSSS